MDDMAKVLDKVQELETDNGGLGSEINRLREVLQKAELEIQSLNNQIKSLSEKHNLETT